MKPFLFVLILVILQTLSYQCQAEWFESTGQAQIRDGDTQSAKARAIEDAIKQALVFAGASVSSVQTVANGLMSQEQIKISSHGEIEHIELVDEVYSGKFVSVTVRLDIFTSEKQCFASDFKKAVAITQIQLENKEHAKIGQIFDIHKVFSEKLYNEIKNDDMAIVPRPYYKNAIDTKSIFEQRFDFNPDFIAQVSKNTDSQYVLISKINDISLGSQQNSELLFWQKEQHERFFALEAILFNALTHEILWQKDYSTSGIWRFKKTAKVDIRSRRFWHSDYGLAIEALAGQISLDLQDKLSCLPIQGLIKQINDNTITFNLGAINGVKKGQVFSLAYKANMIGLNGEVQPNIITSKNKVRINQVFQRSAIASSISDELLANIQMGDVVMLVEWEEPEL